MANFSLTGEAVAQGQASRDNSTQPQTEASKPQEVKAAPVVPGTACGSPTGGNSARDARELARPPRKGERLSDYMADAPLVAEAADEPVLETKLSAGQICVLREIMSGKSISAASKATRVSRSTIYRWQSEDPHYIAALNAWKRQTDESVRNRLLALADRAVTAINNALLSCDTKAAMSLLKGLGMLSPLQHGSPDAKLVEDELKLNRLEAETQIKEQYRAKKERCGKAERGW